MLAYQQATVSYSWEGDTLNLASPDIGLETRFGSTAGGGIRVPS